MNQIIYLIKTSLKQYVYGERFQIYNYVYIIEQWLNIKLFLKQDTVECLWSSISCKKNSTQWTNSTYVALSEFAKKIFELI